MVLNKVKSFLKMQPAIQISEPNTVHVNADRLSALFSSHHKSNKLSAVAFWIVAKGEVRVSSQFV